MKFDFKEFQKEIIEKAKPKQMYLCLVQINSLQDDLTTPEKLNDYIRNVTELEQLQKEGIRPQPIIAGKEIPKVKIPFNYKINQAKNKLKL